MSIFALQGLQNDNTAQHQQTAITPTHSNNINSTALTPRTIATYIATLQQSTDAQITLNEAQKPNQSTLISKLGRQSETPLKMGISPENSLQLMEMAPDVIAPDMAQVFRVLNCRRHSEAQHYHKKKDLLFLVVKYYFEMPLITFIKVREGKQMRKHCLHQSCYDHTHQYSENGVQWCHFLSLRSSLVLICSLKMFPSSSDCFLCSCYSSLCSCLDCIIILSISLFSYSKLLRFSYLFSSLSSLVTAKYSESSTVLGGWVDLPYWLFYLLRGFYQWEMYLEVDGHFGLRGPSGEILESFLLVLNVLAVVVKVSQFIPQQSLGLVNSENASDVQLTLLVELSDLPLLFFLGFGPRSVLGAQSLAIECILFQIIGVGNVVLGDDYLLWLRLKVLFGIQEVATDEGRVEIVGIGPAIFVRTVKGCAHFFLGCLLVQVNSSS